MMDNNQKIFYTAEPREKRVSKEEFRQFVLRYPRPLDRDVWGVTDPPVVTYNDFELADRWPYSTVAWTKLYDNDPDSIFYKAEEDREYYIVENYKELFASRTMNQSEPSVEEQSEESLAYHYTCVYCPEDDSTEFECNECYKSELPTDHISVSKETIVGDDGEVKHIFHECQLEFYSRTPLKDTVFNAYVHTAVGHYIDTHPEVM